MIFGFANRNVVSFLAGAATVMSAVLFYNWTTLDSNPAALPVIHRRKRVVCFGDSITQHGFNTEISGWVAMLAHWWSRRVDVINRGFSGYNSKWARIIVNEAVVPLNPDMVIIFFGANDAVDSSVLQHVPLDQYSDNIRFIVNVIRKVYI